MRGDALGALVGAGAYRVTVVTGCGLESPSIPEESDKEFPV
jgi:hypothetical protein